MGLETATFVDDFVTTNPPGTDKKSQGDDHLRLIKAVLRATFARAGKAFRFPRAISKVADYVVVASDDNTIFSVDTTAGTVTLTLPTLAASDDGWKIDVIKTNTGTNPVFLVPPSGTINGFTKVRRTMEYMKTIIVWNGSNFYATRPNGGCIGEARTFYGSALPNDCLWADGTTFSAANYVELNTAFGGNNKPDVQGRVQIGRGNMSGVDAGRITVAGGNFDATALGGTGGAQNHTLTNGEIPPHTHAVTDPGHSHNVTAQTDATQSMGTGGFGAPNTVDKVYTTTSNTTGISIQSAGGATPPGGGAHSILPPSIVANVGIVAE